MRLFNIDVPFRIKGIYTALEMIWDSKRTFVGESHDFWEIVTVLEGAVEVVEDERSYILRDSEMILHARPCRRRNGCRAGNAQEDQDFLQAQEALPSLLSVLHWGK